jgi:UDP-glucose 4-epimerase
MFMGDGFADGYVNSVESFVRTLEFARKAGAQKFLYASTSSLYGNQAETLKENLPVQMTNHYSVSKYFYENCAECYQKVYRDMDIIGFRFMSVYGPNEEAKGQFANVISQFIWDFVRGKAPLIYGDGTQTRDFTNVEDIVQAIVLALEHPERLGNEIFNIGTGSCIEVNEMIRLIKKYLESPLEAIHIKNPVKENYIMSQHADISKIQRILGYAPKIDLETGIRRQIENLRPEKIRETNSDLLRED